MVCKCISVLANDANPIKLCGMKHDRGASSNFLLCSTLETDSRTCGDLCQLLSGGGAHRTEEAQLELAGGVSETEQA